MQCGQTIGKLVWLPQFSNPRPDSFLSSNGDPFVPGIPGSPRVLVIIVREKRMISNIIHKEGPEDGCLSGGVEWGDLSFVAKDGPSEQENSCTR